jgi:hypothetical protein
MQPNSFGCGAVGATERGRSDKMKRDFKMSKDEKFWSIISIVLVVVFLVASIWLIAIAAEAFAKIAVAIIGAAAVIMGTTLKYSFELKKERNHQEWLVKQENYKELLSKIGDFVREKPGAVDSLTSSHLGSWAFGDLSVMTSTNAFIKSKSRDDLLTLLRNIRESLQQPELPDDFFDDYDTKVLFSRELSPGLKEDEKKDSNDK